MVLIIKMRYSKFSYTRHGATEESEEIMDDNLAKLIERVKQLDEYTYKEFIRRACEMLHIDE